MKDYGAHEFYGYPRERQKLERVKNLILGEIEKIKKGKFEKLLLKAVIKDFRLNRIYEQEGDGTAWDFVDTFIQYEEWINYLTY